MRWEASACRKQIKIVEPRDFRLVVTPAVVSPLGRDRYRPVIELLASGIANIKRHNNKLA